MQIPMGNFGSAQAQEPGVVAVPRPTADPYAGQLALADTAMRISGDMLQDERQKAIQQQRAAAALTLATTSNELQDAHDSVVNGLKDGSIATDQAGSKFRESVTKIKSANLTGLVPEQRAIIDDNIVMTTGKLERSLGGAVLQRKQTETGAVIDQFGEQVQRETLRIGPEAAISKYGAMVDFSGSAAGLTPEQIGKRKQAFAENVTYSFYNAAGSDALTRGDVKGLDAVMQRIAGPEGEALDPIKRTQLTHQIFGYKQHLEAKAERDANAAVREQEQRVKLASDTYGKGWDLVASGQYLSPEYIKELTTATAGTEYEKPTLDLLGSQKKIAGFASLSAADRAAVLERERSAGATPGQGTSPEVAKTVAYMERIDRETNEMAKENPWLATQKRGVIQDAPILTTATMQSGEFLPIFQKRMQTIGTVENYVGRKVSPLQPAEAEAFAKGVHSLPIDQQATLLASVGAMIGDPERIAMLSKQLGDKDGHMGLAMSYAGSQTTLGNTTASLLLRGSQAIKDKTVKVDGIAESGWRASIAKEVRGTFPNQMLEDKAIEAAFLITAANGGSDIPRAIRLATGGVMDFNGSKIPLPYGMASEGQSDGEKKFKKAIAAIDVPALLPQASQDKPDPTGAGAFVVAGNAKIPLDQFVKSLPDAKLVHAGQGLYNVRAGTTLVTNAQGKRIVIKVAP